MPASGYPLDHRSNIYQLGATLYHLLSGRPPLEGGTLAATITLILTAIPEPIRAKNMAVPAQLDSVITKMLATNPRDRYPSAKELERALEMVVSETQQLTCDTVLCLIDYSCKACGSRLAPQAEVNWVW